MASAPQTMNPTLPQSRASTMLASNSHELNARPTLDDDDEVRIQQPTHTHTHIHRSISQ